MTDTITRPTPDSLLEGLNDDQKRAVTTTEGPVLVVAGPGSGKTRVLTHRIAWLLEQDIPAWQILAVTFTNKAAREMRERIARLVGEERAASLVMGTFHSFGMRVLRSNPGAVAEHLNLQPGFTIYDTGDQLDLAKRSINAVGLDPKVIQPRRMLSAISKAKALMMTPDEVQGNARNYDDEIVARVYREYERELRQANAVDFDDLLGLPLRLFDENEQLLERYQSQFRYILVDEYQDTNRVQYVLVSALAEKWRNLFVVGDPDQSIYGWRQADIKNILDFRETYQDVTQIDLEINYRSTAHIVAAADRLIRENTQRIDRKIRTDNADGEKIQVRELTDQSHEAKFIVEESRRLISAGTATAADIAVMYRTTAQSRALEEEFRNSSIAYRIIGGLRFYERKEVRDVLAMLRLISNPADRISLERVIDNLPLGKGFGPKAMETADTWAAIHRKPLMDAFLAIVPSMTTPDVDPPAFSGAGLAAAQRIGTAYAHLKEHAGTVVLSQLFDEIVAETQLSQLYREGSEEDLQRWANVQELRSDLERYDALPPEEQLSTYLEQVALVADVDSLPEDTSGAVTLITLHSAKGLEFPVVFIAGAEEGLLPISRAVENEAFDKTEMEEERRLFYVGVTRAKQLLYVTYAASRMTYGRFQNGAASRFIDSLPAESIRSITRRERVGATSGGYGRFEGRPSGRWSSQVSSSWKDSSSSSMPAQATVSEPLPDYDVGMRVFHAKFGEGTIVGLTEKSNDVEVAVDFARHGTKRLLGSLARLEIIS
jgi:DNA helicase-2/ATP-dependent DNA helicase PcrA